MEVVVQHSHYGCWQKGKTKIIWFIIQNYMWLTSINDEDLSDSNNPLQYWL